MRRAVGTSDAPPEPDTPGGVTAKGAVAGLPPRVDLKRRKAHRLIPSKYSDERDSVLVRIADDDHHLQDIFDLDHATNDRLIGQNQGLAGIGPDELLAPSIPYHRIVNAAFCHPNPLGARFSGPDRGAWYAAFELETSQAEVVFHKTVEFAEINWWHETLTYDDYLADFDGPFHDLRNVEGHAACLDPDSYVASQALAEHLGAAGSLGVIYPSVRRRGGTCIACFRPGLVGRVRRGGRYRIAWLGTPTPRVTRMRREK